LKEKNLKVVRVVDSMAQIVERIEEVKRRYEALCRYFGDRPMLSIIEDALMSCAKSLNVTLMWLVDSDAYHNEEEMANRHRYLGCLAALIEIHVWDILSKHGPEAFDRIMAGIGTFLSTGNADYIKRAICDIFSQHCK
jgi:hypothetical protein